jgi:hypothetical protein
MTTCQHSARRLTASALVLGIGMGICFAAPLSAVAEKLKGQTNLKDVQPAGTQSKDQKHQIFDLSFESQSHTYTCRTNYKKSVNAADFVVGSPINYEIDGDKVKIKTQQNKKVECKVVRVEQTSSTTTPTH